MPKLTKRSVDALGVRATNYIAFDAELPGFGVRVMPSGKRFFLVQYRRHGRTRRVMLGQFGPLTAEVARRRALILLAQTHSGGSDPAAERDALRQSLTVEQLGARFLKEHVAVRCKPTTQSEYRRSVELFIDRFFGKQRILSVTTADVAELHGSLSHIPYQANRTLGVLSKMMNLAEIWGLRDRHSNPCEDIQRYPERKRERFLSLEEVKALGRALYAAESDGSEGKYSCTALRLLLLTGCRLSEIRNLEWKHVYLDEGELRLSDSKTGPKTIHLGAAAIALLRTLPRVEGNPFVIVGKNPGSHLTHLQRPWRRIRRTAGLDDVRIHDLRHTFASGGLAVGEGLPGDYEAQVSQRPIAIHGLEHIGATDRGVMMFRNQTRRGIRAVQAGHDPKGLCHDAGVVIPTYCNDTVVRMPPDVDPTMDRQRMRDTGRRLADAYLKDPPLSTFNTVSESRVDDDCTEATAMEVS